MTAVASGLLDTSVFVSRESGPALRGLPTHVAVSVITIGELHLGVLAAPNEATRSQRADTLAFARGFDPIPISEAVTAAWARLVHDCRTAGIHRTIKLSDALIAATAIEHGLPVVTRDSDYEQMARAHPALSIISV